MQAQSPGPAESYDASVVRSIMDPWAIVLLDQIGLKPGEHVLDVACGTGAVSFAALDRVGSSGSVTGADINPGMLDFARKKAESRGVQIDWIHADAEHLPARPGGFDVVVCQHGMQFFPDTQASIQAMFGALAPGGRVGINVWAAIERQGLFADFEVIRRGVFGDRATTFQPFKLDDPDRFTRELTSAGFSDVKVAEVPGLTSFPDAGRFVSQAMRGAAVVMPELADLTPGQLDDVIGQIANELGPYLDRYRDGRGVTFEMIALIATGTRPVD